MIEVLKTRRWLVLVGVLFVLLALAGIWWVRRDSGVTAEAAPLVEPVVYGERITRVVDAEAGMAVDDKGERECLLAKVNADTALVEALGDRPNASPRFAEVQQLYEACQAMGSAAGQLKSALVKHGQPEPNETQLRCLAEALGAYPAGERDQVLAAELVDVPAGALRDKVRELVAICGLDSSLVPR